MSRIYRATMPAPKAPSPSTGGGNAAYVVKVQGLRQSGAAGFHGLRGSRRLRTRAAAARQAIHDDVRACGQRA